MERPKNKNEYRKNIAEMFLKILEEDGLNWVKTWKATSPQVPFNGITKIRYKGLNNINLGIIAMMNEYKDPRWYTMVQIMDKKGTYHKGQKWHLQKGTKAAFVEYWFPYDSIKKKMLTWTEYNNALKSNRDPKDFVLCSRYTAVFNASCIDGIPELKKYENNDVQVDNLITTLSTNMNVEINYDGIDRAYYVPDEDKIHLPEISSFTSSEAFNTTALHELAHSTGHKSRLNRDIKNYFGSNDYAFEELIAEMTACFMSFNINIEVSDEHMQNHKAYIQSWVQSIKQKPDVLTKAIKAAQEAADYMEQKANILVQA